MNGSTGSKRYFRTLRLSVLIVAIAIVFAGSVVTSCNGWVEYCHARDQANISELNAMVATYTKHQGNLPDVNLIELYKSGYTKKRLHETPFGGYYRLDPKQLVVYNPHR